ncbi:dienelactone hydrolase family protein [Chishuiella sp.]|uniref:carboxylesterase family protein n=1 Tax=Chishuiella sp. TaxID=1969467 RepID=UPI0028A715EE|nr:dienelactone hydrolase family protein [Chishuiella sp.]
MNKKLTLIGAILLLNASIISCSNDDNSEITTTQNDLLSTKSSMTQFSFKASDNVDYGYWLYTPSNPTENMPLIVYLHGGSGRGSDLNLLIEGSLPKLIYENTVTDIPAYVLMAQCPEGKTWEQIAPSLMELVDYVKAEKLINESKISLTGHSLGGSGTWNIGANYISKFSCIAPLSGSVELYNAANYKNIPIYAFVGSDDTIVDPSATINIVPLINNLGGNAKVKVYDGATHFDVPDLTYLDSSANLLNWLITQTK